MKLMGITNYICVSTDMFKKIDSLNQTWFKKIDEKAKSTPVARVDGEWLFDSKDIAKKLIEVTPSQRHKVVVPMPDGRNVKVTLTDTVFVDAEGARQHG